MVVGGKREEVAGGVSGNGWTGRYAGPGRGV